jgi:hypothetical protein
LLSSFRSGPRRGDRRGRLGTLSNKPVPGIAAGGDRLEAGEKETVAVLAMNADRTVI